jgi:hypothetical protein
VAPAQGTPAASRQQRNWPMVAMITMNSTLT